MISRIIYFIVIAATYLVSVTLQYNLFASIICAGFWPIAWIFWLCTHAVTASVLQTTFAWFFA